MQFGAEREVPSNGADGALVRITVRLHLQVTGAAEDRCAGCHGQVACVADL